MNAAPDKLITATPLPTLASQFTGYRAPAPITEAQGDFAAAISRAKSQDETVEQKTRKVAEDFVSVALVQPILKQMRESNHAAPPFAPGPGEKMFRQIADAQLSRQLVRSSRWGVVDSLARRLLDNAQGRVPEHPSPKFGPKLDKIRPQLEPVIPQDGNHRGQSELDTQA